MDTSARLCATACLPINDEDTAQAARRQGVPESAVWNARRANDNIRTPARDTRDLVDEILWWHNTVSGTQLTVADIMSRSRVKEIVNARGDVMKRLRDVKKWSYPRIGHYFGGMDHTSVMFMCRRPTMTIHGITKLARARRAAKRMAGANERKSNDAATMEASQSASQADMVQ
jgi:hypothetical protein